MNQRFCETWRPLNAPDLLLSIRVCKSRASQGRDTWCAPNRPRYEPLRNMKPTARKHQSARELAVPNTQPKDNRHIDLRPGPSYPCIQDMRGRTPLGWYQQKDPAMICWRPRSIKRENHAGGNRRAISDLAPLDLHCTPDSRYFSTWRLRRCMRWASGACTRTSLSWIRKLSWRSYSQRDGLEGLNLFASPPSVPRQSRGAVTSADDVLLSPQRSQRAHKY